MPDRIYFDTNATAPLAPEVRAAMDPWLQGRPANPSSVHREGRQAHAAVEQAREQVAALVGGGDVVFTSGGTEADNLALHGLVGWPAAGHVVVSAIEHPAVLEPAAALERTGVRVSLLPVDAQGRVDANALEDALTTDTRVVSIMAANNETGVIEPISTLAEIAARHGVPLHCDAVQAAAWLDLPALLGRASLVSLSAHKIGGPPGVGALVLRQQGLGLEPILRGGGQQRALRPGTEPTALIVGFGAACERVQTRRRAEAERIGTLTQRLRDALARAIDGVRPTLSTERLPNTLHLCIDGVAADALVARLDLEGLAASAGSACHSGVVHRSHVLAAMGLPAAAAAGALRLSLGYHNRDREIEPAVQAMRRAVAAVRAAELPVMELDR